MTANIYCVSHLNKAAIRLIVNFTYQEQVQVQVLVQIETVNDDSASLMVTHSILRSVNFNFSPPQFLQTFSLS
jgi:hypothetical protein